MNKKILFFIAVVIFVLTIVSGCAKKDSKKIEPKPLVVNSCVEEGQRPGSGAKCCAGLEVIAVDNAFEICGKPGTGYEPKACMGEGETPFVDTPKCCAGLELIMKGDKYVCTKQDLSFSAKINSLLQQGAAIKEIENPNLSLPSDINAGQIKKYFQMDNILFALVLRNSTNVVLSLPENFEPSFAGVLVAEKGDTQWTKLVAVKDAVPTNKNNPYYLVVDGQKLLLTVVDQNGAGSGEGIEKVFALSEKNDWKLEGCYYFGGSYSDSLTDGDYFAFSVNFSKQTVQPMKLCGDVQLVLY